MSCATNGKTVCCPPLLSLSLSHSLRLHTTTVFKEPFPLKAELAEEEQEEEAEEKVHIEQILEAPSQ